MSLNFAASGDKLETPTFVVPTQVTMAAWVKNPPFANTGPRLFENTTPTTRFFFSSTGDLIYQRLLATTGQWEVKVADQGGTNWANWNHIAVTFDASSNANVPKMYINGVERTVTVTTTPTGTVNTTSNVMTVANRPTSSRNIGLAQHVGIYSAVLSQANITFLQSNAHYGTSQFANWTFNSLAATYTDLSGNGRTATVVGAPTYSSDDPTLSVAGIAFTPTTTFTVSALPRVIIPIGVNITATFGVTMAVESGTPYAGGPGAGVGGVSKGKTIIINRRRRDRG